MKKYKLVAVLVLGLLISGCGAKPQIKEEERLKAIGAGPSALPAVLIYPNATELDLSSERRDSSVNHFYVFQTTDSLEVVERFYQQAITGLCEVVGFSTSRSDKVIVLSAEEVNEGGKAGNQAIFCILIRTEQGTVGSLIYLQKNQGVK